jgi:nucleotide-binding universal stress UspA family protein
MAMTAVILAVLEHPPVAARVLAAGLCLAERTRAAHINGLVIRVPPIETIMRTEEILSRADEIRIRTDERRRADALKAIFDAWSIEARKCGLETDWCDMEGRADQGVAAWGRRADFIVLKRPGRRNPEPDRQAIHAALFETDRPVLVVPPEPEPMRFGKTIAIAWRPEARTVKAVLAALRWISQAETVHVLAGMRDGTAQPHLPDILAEHGVTARLHVLHVTGQDAFGEVLLTKARELACDMMVMGAFARHPLRSLVLGGVTRHMLSHADLPILMRH